MIESSSSFIASSIPVYHNAVKSIIFKCAELLMGIFVFKLFSLIAARSKQFTSYLMFTEDYIQRFLYILSRGISRACLVVLAFSILNIVLSLYGTVLWALDSPGYIFRPSNSTAADYQDERNDNPPYIIQLYLNSDQLDNVQERLPQTIGAELFNPGLNYTLTGQVSNDDGEPEVVKPTQELGVGARIWLDNDGFSISPDSYAMYPTEPALDGEVFPAETCIRFSGGSAVWNCTFDNVFSQDIVSVVADRPEIHWSDASDQEFDSRYILPNRVDNIWFSFGAGGGSATMTQVFTVTKGTKRHTFTEYTLKVTMLTSPGNPFAEKDVEDLVERTWSANETERSDPLIGRIVDDMMSAQQRNMSYQFGANTADNGNKSVLQSNWGFYTVQAGGKDMFSLLSIISSNITLVRSETIANAPQPLEKCDRGSFQNEAFGAKLTQTDCAAAKADTSNASFFGQVDTAAVLITHGLGDGRSNLSSQSLDNDVLTWMWNASGTIESLLVARAYTVSVDPALVQISVDKLIVAISRLQLVLSCLALVLAVIAWLALVVFADGYWSNTLLANLVHATSDPNIKAKPGYMTRPPIVALLKGVHGTLLTIAGKTLALFDPSYIPVQPVVSPAPEMDAIKQHAGAYTYPVVNEATGGQEGLLSGYENGGLEVRESQGSVGGGHHDRSRVELSNYSDDNQMKNGLYHSVKN
ncbi:hypothetical protein FZEAL_7575 [Fusarium zealandicum]|uniref:Uncharacterized protein n=1 Tax=Fusarium zealandicum TaxID=1053134 RepID=A0A8H4UFQ8_9HYPO|nr:hypothetical protein FZEAL_7575 [Fusarium zealandicum]